MDVRFALIGFVTLVACAGMDEPLLADTGSENQTEITGQGEADPPAQRLDANVGSGDAGTIDASTADAADEVEPEPTPALPPPVPAAALCSGQGGGCDCTDQDLNAYNGSVSAVFGPHPPLALVAQDPLGRGPYEVVQTDHDVSNPNEGRDALATTVYLPSEPRDARGMPLLLLLPGFTLSHRDSAHFSEHFASHGVAVVGFTPRNWSFLNVRQDNAMTTAEGLAVLDWALSADSPLAGRVDASRLGVAGYSEGGKIAFHAAALDARLKLVIAWDPQNGAGAPCFVPIFGGACNNSPAAPNCQTEEPGVLHRMRAESLVFAARDTGATPDGHMRAEHFYRGAPSPSHLLMMPDVGHTGWLPDGAAVEVTQRVHTAFVLERFFGATGLEDYLPAGSYAPAQSEVSAVYNK